MSADTPEPDASLTESFDEAGLEALEERLQPEERLGSTPAGVAANAALRALSKAARSVLLYEVNNEAIRRFIREYRTSMSEALSHGPLELEVRPFEVVRGSEIIYLERSQDRSLAFRLFRDGVRRLRIQPDVEWDELFRLLEILSIRYVGVRQNEDDIVTLLWKAGFGHIQVVAVEGFVLEEDLGEETEDEVEERESVWDDYRSAAGHVDVPRDWDLPVEAHQPSDGPLTYRAVSGAALAGLRDEIASSRLAEHALVLVEESLRLVGDPTDPTSIADMLHYLGEVREFLLSEGQIDHLLTLVGHLQSLEQPMGDRLDSVLRSLADHDALRRIVSSMQRDTEQAPIELLELLVRVPGEHLESLVRILQSERGKAARSVARGLIEGYVEQRYDYVRQQVLDAEPRVAADLLGAVGAADAEKALELAAHVVVHDEPDIQREVLDIIGRSDPAQVETKILLQLLASPDEQVRMQVIARIGQRGDRRAFRKLIRHLDGGEGTLSWTEAEAVGRAMLAIHPSRVARDLPAWIRPDGWLTRLRSRVQKPTLRHWAAVVALCGHDDANGREAVTWLKHHSGPELSDHCRRLLRTKRHGGDAGG